MTERISIGRTNVGGMVRRGLPRCLRHRRPGRAGTRCRSSRSSPGWRSPPSPMPPPTRRSSSRDGGSWDATNVADGSVAVLTPIAASTVATWGGTGGHRARRRASSRPARSRSSASSRSRSRRFCWASRGGRCDVAREGLEFGVTDAAAGHRRQMVTIQGSATWIRHLPRCTGACAQRRLCVGRRRGLRRGQGLDGGLDAETVREALAQVTSPGRLEIVRRSPTVVLDVSTTARCGQRRLPCRRRLPSRCRSASSE